MIYFIQCGENGPIKIGQSDDPEGRMAQLQIGCPYELKLLWAYTGNRFSECGIHLAFIHENIRGEWFHPSRCLIDFITGEMENIVDVLTPHLGECIRITELPMNEIMVEFGAYGAYVLDIRSGDIRKEY